MGRKKLLEAKARAWQRIIDRSKIDPVGLETDLRRYNFLKSTVLFLILLWMFKEAILFSFGKNFESQFKFLGAHAEGAALVVLIMGMILYIFRERYRFYYGLVEVSFSVALAYGLLLHVDGNGLGGLLGVIGAIYVTVRGIDNICTGYKLPRLHHKANPVADVDATV